ncbi:Uncharacterised protein [Mycobacterium tuberculosis]|uniref:Uncharacterized protein n=1 Tax=Mycobacterium tuberculosis TaxID=1773 RepID=A0A655AQF1_MYCTX|nr:Uncharacterised protein [Mycobacterium tuberculosis]CKT42009.1 Uncharacterised protein [Mycobacterium tuberculosis]CKT51345.1 Uncharacterised protein [Mycobacterium tuberculosis]CKT74714.1 Uncharacterised protein [Mycobacterium tuberculosis]CNV60813.1 Uncharacterised protein [Mycobacterium tuberculosis]
MLGRAGAAQDGQPTQLVGLVVGGRVGEHVRLGVLDADHAVDAVGQGLCQPEQVGSGIVGGVGPVTMMLQDMIHQVVQPFPAGPRLHGYHRRAGADGPGHHRVRRVLDEDRHRRPLACLIVDPAHRLVVGDPDQEEHIGRARRGRQAQPHVVGIDQRRRRHRQVQAARGVHQADHGRIQRQEQLAEPHAGDPHVVRSY